LCLVADGEFTIVVFIIKVSTNEDRKDVILILLLVAKLNKHAAFTTPVLSNISIITFLYHFIDRQKGFEKDAFWSDKSMQPFPLLYINIVSGF